MFKNKHHELIVVFFLGISVGSIITSLVIFNHLRQPRLPDWAISSETDGYKSFNLALKKRFPIGAETKDVIKELKKAGFTMDEKTQLMARRIDITPSCVHIVRAFWKEDQTKKIITINSHTFQYCT